MRNRSLLVLAALAALLPLSALAERGGLREKFAARQSEASTKYTATVGYSYTNINQVNQGLHALQGVKLGLGRDFKKYYALGVEGAYYVVPFGNGGGANPGDPSVFTLYAAPEIHAEIWGPVGGFIHGVLGVEHTGGENMSPDTSFAGGYGGGLEYKLRPNLGLRLWGDDVTAAFSLRNATAANAYSAHKSSNAQVTFGAVYHF